MTDPSTTAARAASFALALALGSCAAAPERPGPDALLTDAGSAVGARCGDGTCELVEQCDSCPEDCGACVCGDGLCSGDETCEGCAADCGSCCTATPDEPNDDWESAVAQRRDPPFACDGHTYTAAGSLDGTDDEDWYKFVGVLNSRCQQRVRVDAPDARVCVFPACADLRILTPHRVACVVGEAATAASFEGRPGCCAAPGSTEILLEALCNETGSQVTQFYVRVADGAAGACVDYDVTLTAEPR